MTSTMQNVPEAFLLLTLLDSSLTLPGKTENGSLRLECVTMPNPEAKEQRDVYLVLRVNATEVPIDPGRIVTRADTPIFRTYTFTGTQLEPADVVLRVNVPDQGLNPELSDQLEAFDSILEQYVTDFRRPGNRPDVLAEAPIPPTQSAGLGVTSGEKDLRGHLVLINEETGEVIGEVQENFRIKEDPALYEAGHQKDPVIIEIPEETTRVSDPNALEAFASLVPPDQQNWITKSASIVSHAISMTTNLLMTTMTSATDFYISHSSPSPHHTGATATAAWPNNKNLATSASSTPPPLPPRPPRVLVFLTSEKTRKGLSTVHTLSGEAVKMSSKTLHAIDSMIRRAMGARPKRDRYFASPSRQGLASVPPLPSRPFAPGNSLSPTPPPYEASEKYRYRSAFDAPEKGKAPVLPPRSSTSPVPPPLPPRRDVGTSSVLPVQPRLTTKERLLISADLILSTLDDSARKLLDSTPDSVGRIMAHKYGPEAAQSSVLLAGTARNAGLVYVDMSGMGRRALLRRAGRTFMKARLSSNKPNPMRA